MTETDPYLLDYGVPQPVREDYDSDEAYSAAFDAWLSGFSAYVFRRTEEENAARIAAEEAAAQQLQEEQTAHQREEEEESVHQSREEGVVSTIQEVEQQLGEEDRYPIGSYIDAAGNVWSPVGELLSGDGTLTDSYVDPAGHLWSMERSTSMEQQPLMEGEVSTGEPVVDTALLLLDLVDALTGEEGMTNDVDGIQQVLEHPFMTTSFQDYTVTEGLLLLLLLSIFIAACARMLKEGFAWLR